MTLVGGGVSAIRREVIIGPCRLILGEAVAVASQLSAEWHAVVADPPYGIGFLHSGGGRGTGFMTGGAIKPGQYNTRFHGEAFRVPGDDQPFDPRPLLTAAGKRPVILWGGNHYAHLLPPGKGGWLAWQKNPDKNLGRVSFSDGEFAWRNFGQAAKFKRHVWMGMTRAGRRDANGITRFHPTQKPVEIMQWCIELLPKKPKPWGDTIIDPYMGSGSTAIAAIQAGVKFIGVEMSERWFDVAVDRVRKYMEATA